jgi:hypothetical protein
VRDLKSPSKYFLSGQQFSLLPEYSIVRIEKKKTLPEKHAAKNSIGANFSFPLRNRQIARDALENPKDQKDNIGGEKQ